MIVVDVRVVDRFWRVVVSDRAVAAGAPGGPDKTETVGPERLALQEVWSSRPRETPPTPFS
ncbi:hypothetical protein [Saccharopolyspora sp. NPDC002578]